MWVFGGVRVAHLVSFLGFVFCVVCPRPVSCVPNVASFSRLFILHCHSVLFVFVLCVVYQMLPVSLDCPFLIAPQFCLFSSYVLCTKCCRFLWIVHYSLPLSFVCLHPVSCVPNVASFSGLSILHCPSVFFLFILCLVYPMLSVSLDCPFLIALQFCLSSSCVLCTKCCQFLWIVHSSLPLSFLCLHPLSCVPNVVSFSGLSILELRIMFHVYSFVFLFSLGRGVFSRNVERYLWDPQEADNMAKWKKTNNDLTINTKKTKERTRPTNKSVM